MQNERWTWARDWAWIGATTSAVSPWVAGRLIPIDLDSFTALACVLGGSSGAVVGWLFAGATALLPERSRVSIVAVFAPVALGAWGGLVATVSAAFTEPDLIPLALACGTSAALVQTMWLAPLYVWLVERDGLRVPLVLGGALVSPLCGLLAVVVGLTVRDGIVWLSRLGGL